MPHVLVVEDDRAIAEAVVYALKRDGVLARSVDTLAGAREGGPGSDLLILDLTLPDGSGFSLLDELRRWPRAPRVIVLTSRDEDVDCVAALEAGADDFVTKPFSPRALVARVRAVLRRGQAPSPPAPAEPAAPGPAPGPPPAAAAAPGPPPPPAAAPAPGLVVDAERRRVTFAGREVGLTKIEFDLLAALAATPGRVRTRGQLVETVWGPSYALTERTVDSHLKGLRRKLEEAGAPATLVETVRGVGFRLREEP
ncbi:MAG TPA: response regulator transcription factor [Polyangiaceae bacterium]|nr:response regulator transcription factor [Polyangiaceae bacterium]